MKLNKTNLFVTDLLIIDASIAFVFVFIAHLLKREFLQETIFKLLKKFLAEKRHNHKPPRLSFLKMYCVLP